MLASSVKPTILQKLGFTAVSCVLAFSLVTVCGVSTANADVRRADIVLGQTVEQRDLSIAQCPSIDAEYALVMSDDGTIYFERNGTTDATIASITKIMTALVALDTVDLDTIITVSAKAAQIGESSAALQEGDTLTLKMALYALMVPSGNDAALAIAQSVGGKMLADQGYNKSEITDELSEEIFVKAMNEKAASLNMTGTVFTNAHGLDDGEYESNQHSCARDVAIMGRTAMGHSIFREVVASPTATIEVRHSDGKKESHEVESTDELLGTSGFCGIKTGFTDSAGACFAGAATSEHGYLYAIILKSSSTDQRFADAEDLVDWVTHHYIKYPLVHSSTMTQIDSGANPFGENPVPVVAEVAHTEWINKTVKATLADPKQTVSVFDLNGNIAQTIEYDEVKGNVEIGEKVGKLTFTQRGEIIQVVDIVACEQVAGPDFFEGVGIWWERLFNNFSGGKDVADSVLINTTPLINDKQV